MTVGSLRSLKNGCGDELYRCRLSRQAPPVECAEAAGEPWNWEFYMEMLLQKVKEMEAEEDSEDQDKSPPPAQLAEMGKPCRQKQPKNLIFPKLLGVSFSGKNRITWSRWPHERIAWNTMICWGLWDWTFFHGDKNGSQNKSPVFEASLNDCI